MVVNLGEPARIEAEVARCVEFEVSDPRAFAKSMGVIGKLIDEACFEARDNERVVLEQIDPSHVALVRFGVGFADLGELKVGDKLCFSVEKLNKILGRMRRDDETVRLSAREDRVVVKFPTTEREFTIERVDVEPEELHRPELRFDVKARVDTKELKAVLRDVPEAYSVKLSANDGVVLSAETNGGYSKRFKDPYLIDYEARVPSTAAYSQKYLEDVTTTEFDIATLRWSKDMPIEISYEPMLHSRLEFLIAPKLEAE